MPKEPDKPENPSTDEGGPPTLAPGADPDVHDRPTHTGAPRPTMPTLTDPAELEDARRRSMPSSPVHEKLTAPPGGHPSPTALSLVNARAPSVPPPPPVVRHTLDSVWDGFDDEGPLVQTSAPSDGRSLAERQAAVTAPPAAAGAVTAPPAAVSPEQDLRDRLALGDFTGALAVAETILAARPGHAEALAAVDTCRDTLRKMYAARIGPLDRVPQVAVAREQMRWLSIDHRAGFVLSLVDGVSTIEMLLDVSGMPELDALRILSELLQQRIITLR